LLGYNDARARAGLIAAVTRQGRMPPWLPEPSDFPFADERRLAERDIRTLERWAEQGAAEGDAASAPAAPTWSSGWTLGEPDLVLEMPEAYTLAAGQGDVFRNFVLPVPLDRTHYVRAVELQPGDPRVVHHAVIAVDASGVAREDDAADEGLGYDGMFSRRAARPPSGFFAGWTPGHVTRPNAEGLAWPLEPKTDIVIQMHFRKHSHDAAVRAKLGFYFADSTPARTPTLLRLGAQTIDIPAGESAYTVSDSFRIPVDVEVLGLYPHAHYLARIMDVRVAMPDGKTRQLLRIDDWDFNWQDSYSFREPVQLPAGAVLRLRYVYDNSSGNPHNPNPEPRRVIYGPSSTDEMAELWLQILPRVQGELATLQRDINRKSTQNYVEGWQHQIRMNPNDAVALASLAAVHNSAGDTAGAIELYNRAIAAKPGYASAHYNLGIVLESKRDLEGAAQQYREALRARPNHAGTHNNLGNVLVAQNHKAEAAEHFRRAIELDPNSAEAYNNLGRLLWSNGENQQAIVQYRRAVEKRPDAAAVRFNLALALASVGKTEEGLKEFQEGTRLEPRRIEAYVAMSWLLATHPDASVRSPAQALTLAERAAELYGQPHARIHDAIAAAHAAAGRFEQAAVVAQQGITLADQSGQQDLARQMRDRHRLYTQKRPYIERRPN
jgi:tetratricopeptide (TPR) repeat protein